MIALGLGMGRRRRTHTKPLRLIQAIGEVFGIGDGVTRSFPLTFDGQLVRHIESAAIYRDDWQGNQRLYPTPRTNMLRQSSDLTTADWLKASGASVLRGAALGPDGVTPANLIRLAGTVNHQVVQDLPSPLPLGSTYTLSAWLKGDVGSFDFQLAYYDGGAFIAGAMAGISGAEWSRRVAVLPIIALAKSPQIRVVGYGNGSDGNSVYVTDLQLETGGSATSHITTLGGPATATDYVLGSNRIVQLAFAPAAGARLSWTGEGYIYSLQPDLQAS